MKNKDEVVAFFTSDIVRVAQKPVMQAGYKEGYLTKRGKNFGGWKTRFFVLQGPSLEYYESVSTCLDFARRISLCSPFNFLSFVFPEKFGLFSKISKLY